MKKRFLLLALCIITSKVLKSQLSGILSVPGTYTSIAAAITDVNTQGVNGATTLQISSNYTETVPSGGFTLTATGTAANPIIFKKTGAGANPLLIAYSGGIGTPTTAIQDGIWRFIGSDYITIDGIDLLDQNTSNPATMEFGFGFFKASPTNGCRNNTIKNCAISLNRINNETGAGPAFSGSKGIEFVNALANSHTLAVTVSAGSGANSNNLISSNTIQNCHTGVAFSGATVAATSANIDAGNGVGGTTQASGNTIINFGSGQYSAGNFAGGIICVNQQSLTASYNTITTFTSSPVMLCGVAALLSYNQAVMFNTISISAGGVYGILTDGSMNNNTVTISNNNVVNCNSGSNNFTGIFCSAQSSNLVLSNNLIGGIATTSSLGSLTGIECTPSGTFAATQSILSNTVQNFVSSNPNGVVTGLTLGGNSLSTFIIQNNAITNLSRNSASTWPINGIYFGTSNLALTPSVAVSVLNNTISGLSNSGGGQNPSYGIRIGTSNYDLQTVGFNYINNIAGGTAKSAGIYMQLGKPGSSAIGNFIDNLNSQGLLIGIESYNSNAPIISENSISGLSSAGSSTVYGLSVFASSITISKNKIYDITASASGSAYVRGLEALCQNTSTITNNIIGNLFAPNSDYGDAIFGINLRNQSLALSCNVYFNTVRIGAINSTGLNFGSSALYSGIGGGFGAATLTINNNILINLSTPSGTGKACALTALFTNTTTYAPSSNNNLLYAGNPSSTNLIYSNGTLNIQSLTAFQSLFAPREAASVTENTPFLSTIGTSSNFLHVAPPSLSESGGVNITGITDDIDANIRQGNTGYIGTGTAPDIGADEFGTPACSTVSANTITASSMSICAGQSVTLTRSTAQVAVLSGIQQQWQMSSTTGGPYTLVASAAPANLSYASPTLAPGTYYYTFATGCSASSQTATSNEVTVSVYPYPSPVITPSAPVICIGNSNSVSISATGASTFSWSAAAGLSSTTGSQVIANPATTSTYVVTGSNPGGCVGSTSVIVSVAASPTLAVSGNSAVCSGTTVTVFATGANSYSWSNGSTQSTITPFVTSTTVYSVVGTNTAGNCESTAQVTITVYPNPTITISGNVNICAGQSATLTANGASTYSWNNGAITNSIVVNPPTSSLYNVTGYSSIGGCKTTVFQALTVVPAPVVSISGPSKSCSGATFNLVANGAGSYAWSTGLNSNIISVSPNSTSTYSVIGTTGPGCTGTAITTVTVDPTPSAGITSNAAATICEGDAITLTATSDIADSFDWNTGASTNTITVTPVSNTIYTVIVKNSVTNCTNAAQYSVSTDACVNIFELKSMEDMLVQPNPFQQQFQINWTGTADAQLQVYNSIGKLILNTKINPGENKILMDEFANGIYYVKIGNAFKKITKE